jgi:hypothetical protein
LIGFWVMILLFVLLLATGPWWPYSGGWGYAPAGILLVALLVWLLVAWLGWVAFFWPWMGAPPPPAVPPAIR